MQDKRISERVEECPTYWWVILENARREGDFERAAQAQKELARLGIKVRYGRPKRRGGVK